MLDQLVKREYQREQMLAGPMGPYLDVLASRLLQLGYSHEQSRRIVVTASSLGVWLAERGLTPADAGKLELREYLASHKRSPKGRLSDGAVGFTRLPALLAAEGVLCKPDAPAPGDGCLHRFQQYLFNVRGTTPGTDANYRRILRPFVIGLCSGEEPDWSKLTAEYVTDFVLKQTAVARSEKGRIVTAVRSFLHFLTADGIVPPQLARAIPRIRRWRYADLPKRLSAEQLHVVLKACHSEAYGSLRDRAFIALLARLAVRAGELKALRLDDIDWSQGLVHIKQSKTGRGRTLPLAEDAGALLVKYIREERPSTAYREVFLTSATPRRPIGNCVTTTLVQVFLKKLNLDGPGRGAHSFRHTAASLMVENGATLKEVADVLGHRVLSTTGIYVKLDKSSLLEVALPWKGAKV
jgi:site-specific recombinase XerD